MNAHFSVGTATARGRERPNAKLPPPNPSLRPTARSSSVVEVESAHAVDQLSPRPATVVRNAHVRFDRRSYPGARPPRPARVTHDDRLLPPTPTPPAMRSSDLPKDVVYAGREILGELPMAESREVLCTNGIGGYASMTLASSLTRSYHGLLIAALRPPLDRTLLLTKLNETVLYHGKSYHLSTDRRKEHAVQKQEREKRTDGLIVATVDDAAAKVRAGACLDASGSLSPIWRESSSPTAPRLHQGEVLSPAGFELLESFHLEGTVPTFIYAFADAVLEKKMWMKHGQNTVYVTYYLRRAVHAIELRLKALVNHRNHHRRTCANRLHFDFSANVCGDGSSVTVLFTTIDGQDTALSMRLSRGRATLCNEWVTGFVLSEERARGLPDVDDNLHVATFVVELPPGGHVTFVASAEDGADELSIDGEAELAMRHVYEKSLLQKFEDARDTEIKRQENIVEFRRKSIDGIVSPYSPTSISPSVKAPRRRRPIEPCVKQLVLAADQFIISRGGGRSVVAGFHWFADWARDVRYWTMVSLPGLTIATGRFDVARSILQTFSKYVSKGMLPNRFPDDGSAPTEAEYDNADGTLWYFEAIRAYFMATGDLELLLELYPVLQGIVTHHCRGTRFGIKQGDDGLLESGADGLALTWMDAKTDVVYTPRQGKAVELAALWFNALNCMSFFAAQLEHEEESDTYCTMADKTERSFQQKFWNHETDFCYDVIDSGPLRNQRDPTLRPNQLIAASLNWSPLTEEQRHFVVEACATNLLTSHGMRTLSPDSENYRGVYAGDIYSRDMSYHQGVAWAWLLGPFVLAYLRVNSSRELARDFLMPILRSHLNDAGVGQVSELFDGDPPNRARGCIAQAWSVAEVLRAWLATEPLSDCYEE